MTLAAKPGWKQLKKHWRPVAYVLIGLLALFLHFYKLTSIPRDLHGDEAALAYNAFCIANYGVSRDLTSFPVYFDTYIGGQSAASTYLMALLFKLFGVSVLAMRLTNALFGLVTIVFGTLIIRRVLGPNAAVVGAVLLTIMPYFIMQARFGFDCNLFLGAGTAALYVLMVALDKQKMKWFALAGICMGLALYTYVLSYLWMALFCVLCFVYLLYVRQVNMRQVLVYGLALLAVAWPLVLYVVVNMLGLASIEIGPITIPSTARYAKRVGEFTAEYTFTHNIKYVFDVAFFSDGVFYNVLPGFFTMYLISIPFALKGVGMSIGALAKSLKERVYNGCVPVMAFMLGVMTVGLFLGWGWAAPNINRLNGMYFGWAFMTVHGIVGVWHAVEKKRLYAGVLAAVYAVNFGFFAHYYFVRYPIDDYPIGFFYPNVVNVSHYVDEINVNGVDVYFTTDLSDIYYGLANGISPYEEDLRMVREGEPERALNGNLRFYWPGEDALDEDAWYVVWICDYEYQEILNEAGFKATFDDGLYRLYQREVWPSWAKAIDYA